MKGKEGRGEERKDGRGQKKGRGEESSKALCNTARSDDVTALPLPSAQLREALSAAGRTDGRTERDRTGRDGTGRAAGAAELREPPTRGAKPPRQPPLSHATQLGPGPTAGRKCEGVNIRPPCDRCRPVRMRSLGLLAHALCVASVSTATEMSAMGEPEVDAAVAEKFEMKRRLGKGVSAEGLRGAPLRVLRCPRSPCRAAAPPFRSAGRGSIPAAFIRSLK